MEDGHLYVHEEHRAQLRVGGRVRGDNRGRQTGKVLAHHKTRSETLDSLRYIFQNNITSSWHTLSIRGFLRDLHSCEIRTHKHQKNIFFLDIYGIQPFCIQ